MGAHVPILPGGSHTPGATCGETAAPAGKGCNSMVRALSVQSRSGTDRPGGSSGAEIGRPGRVEGKRAPGHPPSLCDALERA